LPWQFWSTALTAGLYVLTKVELGQALSPLGKAIGPGLLEHAKQSGLPIPPDLANAEAAPTGEQLVEVVFEIAAHYFPRLAEAGDSTDAGS
jgi:hypothetical protein